MLITGSNGLLGRSLRRCLLQYKFFVIATGLGADRFDELGGVYEEMDITSLHSCKSILDKYKPDIIVNTAALTNVDDCENNKQTCLNINATSIMNYIPFLLKYDIHFILSSDFVFGGIKGGYLETDFVSVNYYGFPKLMKKIIVNELINFTIVRTSLVYSNNNLNDNFLSWIKSSLQKMKLNIVDDQYRTPTFLTDLISYIENN